MERQSLHAGKVYIVTGSTSGIGKATALLLASEGALVTVHGRRAARADETARDCKRLSPSGSDACIVVGDIENADVRKQLVQKTLEKFGRVDGLVNSAGHCSVGGLEREDLKVMQHMLDVHVVAPFDLCRQLMPELKKNKGSIIMVSSIASMRGIPWIIANTTAKHAMDGMMKAIAVEIASSGVRVNSVNPGMIKTEIFRNEEMQQFQKALNPAKLHPNGRLGEPREVANCIAFLLSSAASMVTGVSLPVDGGLTSAVMWQQ